MRSGSADGLLALLHANGPLLNPMHVSAAATTLARLAAGSGGGRGWNAAHGDGGGTANGVEVWKTKANVDTAGSSMSDGGMDSRGRAGVSGMRGAQEEGMGASDSGRSAMSTACRFDRAAWPDEDNMATAGRFDRAAWLDEDNMATAGKFDHDTTEVLSPDVAGGLCERRASHGTASASGRSIEGGGGGDTDSGGGSSIGASPAGGLGRSSGSGSGSRDSSIGAFSAPCASAALALLARVLVPQLKAFGVRQLVNAAWGAAKVLLVVQPMHLFVVVWLSTVAWGIANNLRYVL